MNESGTLLVIGTDPVKITLCLIEPIVGTYRLAYWQEMLREPGQKTVQQVAMLCQQAERQLGRQLWAVDEQAPYTESADPLRFPPLSQVFVAASPRPRLRVWLSGISERYSLNSALLAVQSSPAQVGGTVPLRESVTSTQLHEMLSASLPDALVLTGGFDVPDPMAIAPVVQAGRLFSHALVRMAPVQRPAVLYAGNRWAVDEIEMIFAEAGLSSLLEILPNVQPHTQWAAPVSLIQGLTVEYWRRCRRTSEYREMSEWIEDSAQLASLELNFARLTQGWMRHCQLPELHSLYQGPDWWMHVWSQQDRETVEIAFSNPNERTPLVEKWPAPQLVSGPWPHEFWPQPERFWWDRLGLAPSIAAIGQGAPQAMIQVLETDIF